MIRFTGFLCFLHVLWPGAPALAHPGVCTYGLAPTGIKARWVSAEAKQIRALAIQEARRLWNSVTTEVPLANVAAELAGVLLLHQPSLSPPPGWQIKARNGSLVPLAPGGTLRRGPEGLVGIFPAGADLGIDLHAISFKARVSRLLLYLSGGHLRLRLDLQQPVDVARLHMLAEPACRTIELWLEEP